MDYFDALNETVLFPFTDTDDGMSDLQVDEDDCDDICLDPDSSFPYELTQCGCAVDDYDDGMDGDHESAFTSIGWGVDESYGSYGSEE